MRLRLLILCLFALPSWGHAQNLSDPLPVDPHVTIGKLPNGLTYYIRVNKKPEHRAELRLAVNVGSVLEDESQRGLAHFVEHMAFNGTTHFAKQQLVKYLESIGMRFGADLNAYTSFDETVYMLTVPTDSTRPLAQGVQILEDWAHGQTFDPKEIEKERGVVIEEWRLGRGAEERMRDKYFPVVFAGSRYAERLPIGTKQSLDTFKDADLVRFYKQWYRPQFMAVIAVGDFDKARVEQLIKQHFSNLTIRDTTTRTMFPVPDQDSTSISITTDKEATQASVSVYYKLPIHEEKTILDYEVSLTRQLFGRMLNSRFHELAQQADPPFIAASGDEGRLIRTKEAFALSAATKDDRILRGLEALLTEALRVQRYGFTTTELEREKQNVLRGYEQANAERDKSESSDYADEYVSSFLETEPIPGIEVEYDLVKKLLPKITAQMVNGLAQTWIGERNRVVVVQAPEKATVKVPDRTEIMDVFALVKKKIIQPYEDRVADAQLVPSPPAPGTIVAQTRDSATNVTVWQLSNGVRVLLKPTDFKADQVIVRGYSPGGESLVADSDFVSAELATTVISLSGIGAFDAVQLGKAMAGKAVRIAPYLAQLEEGFNGDASPRDLETLLQLIYLHATSARRDTTAWQSMQTRISAFLENRNANPEAAFTDTLEVVLAQHHFRARPFSVFLLNEAKLDRALAIYRDRFGDAGDFNFVVVGSFDVDSITPLLLRYLGGLPSTRRKETPRDVGIRPPKGVIERVVRKGVEPKSETQLVFTGPFVYTPENRLTVGLMLDIMEIRLRDLMREEMSGTYGVDVGYNVARQPEPSYSIQIGFGSDPARLDSLTRAVFRQIDLAGAKGFTAEEIAKVKETARREWETNVKRNEYWVGQIAARDSENEPIADILNFPKRLEAITPEQLRQAIALMRKDNYVRVSLRPEK